MSNPLWPATLPAFVLQQGYQETVVDGTIETPVDAGPVKLRRRWTGDNTLITWSVGMTPSQYDTFLAFFKTTLAWGSLPFDWVQPRSQAVTTFRFRKPAPKMTMDSPMQYTVQMNVEVVA